MTFGLLNLSAVISAVRPRRRVQVGWFLDAEKAKFIWPAPAAVVRAEPGTGKSVLRCPAVRDLEARTFQIHCPIDADIGFLFDRDQRPALRDCRGADSAIRAKALNSMVHLSPRHEWRHPDRPILQFATPYTFLADTPVYLNQLPPIAEYRPHSWPGEMIAGRFPIHMWPRALSWAFEWHDTGRPLRLRRDEVWFSLRFETEDPARNIRLVEAEVTSDLLEYVQGVRGVTNYVNQTYSLFKTAAARRPRRLLVEKRR